MANLKWYWCAALSAVLLASCQKHAPVVAPDQIQKQAEQSPLANEIHLTVDQTSYSTTDTILVRLHDAGEEPVFLQGCNHVQLAARADTGWTEIPLWVCVWEGFAVKIPADSSYRLAWPAEHLRTGTYRFFASVYFECIDGQPISTGQCARRDTVYSQEFSVTP